MLNIKREAIVIDPSYLYEESAPELMNIIEFMATDTKLLSHVRGVDTLPVQAFWGEGIYVAKSQDGSSVREFCVDSGVYCVFDADDFEAINPGFLNSLNENNYARIKTSGDVYRQGSKIMGALDAGTLSDNN